MSPGNSRTFDVRALYDFKSESDHELTVREGDVGRIITKEDDGWWKCEFIGRKGYVPSNFLAEISATSQGNAHTIQDQRSTHGNHNSPIVQAQYNYEPTAGNHLSIRKGDIGRVVTRDPGGWWECEFGGKRGFVPSNYLLQISNPPPNTEASRKADEAPSFAMPPPIAATTIRVARALYDYSEDDDTETFSFKAGDLLRLRVSAQEDSNSDGWTLAVSRSGEELGYVPSNFLEMIP